MKSQRGQRGSRGQAPRNRNAEGQRDGVIVHITHPPQIPQLNTERGVRMRFVCNSAASVLNITFANLLDTFLVATTAVDGFDVFQSVRIRAVEVWADAILGAASTVEVQFLGNVAGQFGKTQAFSSTSMAVQPAHVKAVPARRSALAFYQQSSADVAFQITCPVGAVIDLELTLAQRFGTQVAAANALVGATAGAFYIRGFDGAASAASKFTPVADAVQ